MTSSKYRPLRIAAIAMLLLCVAIGASAEPSPEFVPGAWSLILLPDVQNYSSDFPGLLTIQTHWIAKNKDRYNIRYVLGLGDITNHNTDVEWRHAADAMSELDGHTPYAIALGNHDYTPDGDITSRKTRMNEYFPPSRFARWPTFGGVMKAGDIANSYHLFHAGGVDWIIVVLEYAPSKAAVEWANTVLAKHSGRKAILVTHDYLTHVGACSDPTADLLAPQNARHDERLWQELVRQNNFVLTVNGHVPGAGYLASKNDRGKTTHQILVDYQCRSCGGEGYLRILEFWPDGKTVQVKSYSPLCDRSLSNPKNQFRFTMDP